MTSQLRFWRAATLPTDPSEAADWWLAKQALGTLSARDRAAFGRWREPAENQAAYELVRRLHEQAASYAAEPEILQMRQMALRTISSPAAMRHRPRLAAALGAAVVLAGGATAMAWLRAGEEAAGGPEPVASAPTTKRYETRVGERRSIRLDDGSVVSLNTGSLLEIAFSAKRRDVRLLRGQALFQVAHNRKWPFVVRAGDRQVVAVGTAFDVRLDGSQVKVVLVEGKIRVAPIQPRGLSRFLPELAEEDVSAGQQLDARQGVQEMRVATTDVQAATSWTTGHIVFRDDSLFAAAAEFNRYSDRKIIINDANVGSLKVSGVFAAEEPEDFLAAVTKFYPVKVVKRVPGAVEIAWRDRN